MHVHVRHRLPRFGAVLQSDVERALRGERGAGWAGDREGRLGWGWRGGGRLEVVAGEHTLHALDSQEEVCYFVGRKVGQPAMGPEGADQDVAWEEGLEVN